MTCMKSRTVGGLRNSHEMKPRRLPGLRLLCLACLTPSHRSKRKQTHSAKLRKALYAPVSMCSKFWPHMLERKLFLHHSLIQSSDVNQVDGGVFSSRKYSPSEGNLVHHPQASKGGRFVTASFRQKSLFPLQNCFVTASCSHRIVSPQD